MKYRGHLTIAILLAASICSSSCTKEKTMPKTTIPTQNPVPNDANSGTVIYLNAAVWTKNVDGTYQCDFINIFNGRDLSGKNISVFHSVNSSVDVPISGSGLFIYQGRLWATNTDKDLHIFYQAPILGTPFLGLKIKVVIQ